jgi:hypothetical protein
MPHLVTGLRAQPSRHRVHAQTTREPQSRPDADEDGIPLTFASQATPYRRSRTGPQPGLPQPNSDDQVPCRRSRKERMARLTQGRGTPRLFSDQPALRIILAEERHPIRSDRPERVSACRDRDHALGGDTLPLAERKGHEFDMSGPAGRSSCGHERPRSREACRATVAPQSTPIEGGYRPPEGGSPQTRNLSICRQIRPNLTPQWLASNPGSGINKTPACKQKRRSGWQSGPITDQSREGRDSEGRSSDRYWALSGRGGALRRRGPSGTTGPSAGDG